MPLAIKQRTAKCVAVGSAKPSAQTTSAVRKCEQRSRIRLLVADDHALILEGLASTIARQPDMTVVAKAADGRKAVSLWKQHRPGVTLLDLRMPALRGVGATRAIRDGDVGARVIVHTTFDTDEDVYQAA